MVPLSVPTSSAIADRLARLDDLLETHADLWRPQVYKLESPAWCERHPQLVANLLALPDHDVDVLMADHGALIDFVARAVPTIRRAAPLIELPPSENHGLPQPGPHAMRDVPGRKAAQIERFAAAVGHCAMPVVEWCAGKGHLGRRLALSYGALVTSLEVDARLCDEGRALARRDGIDTQRFVTGDVSGPFARGHLRERHAVALHACGDLHRALLEQAVEDGAGAIHLAPCCYHKVATPARAVMGDPGFVMLSRNDLRLAVSDAATAAPREIMAARLESAWMLGFRAVVAGERQSMRLSGHRHAKIPCEGGFRNYCEQSASHAGLAIDSDIDWAAAEREAIALEHRVRRLALPRLAFRRVIETRLVFDRARFLEQHGYRVSVSQFCERRLTPRNILIAAVR
ncbi:MAG TPA: methyltransferase [Rhodocyclaceae bacterium]|nr:methyltransferase [Rhodocyclaceae bacterium]